MKIATEIGEQDVPRHPIAVVAERTGLSQDVLRVWERRYRAVEPTRGSGGHRTYSDADVVRLRLLNAVTSAGRSIGQVARLSTDELSRMADEDTLARRAQEDASLARGERPERQRAADVVEEALVSTAGMDAVELEHVLRRAAMQLGVIAFIEDVASPLLRRIGDDWHAGRSTIAHEHLVSATVHDIVAEVMRSMARQGGVATVLVATPAGERHAIGAALVGATAAAEGWRVLYLGADVPAREIASAAAATAARVVAVSLTFVRERARILDELATLRTLLPSTVVLIAGGAGAIAIAAELEEAGIRVGASLTDLRDALTGAVEADAA